MKAFTGDLFIVDPRKEEIANGNCFIYSKNMARGEFNETNAY